MFKSFFSRLYVRIWLAVVVSVLLLTLVFGWLWRNHLEKLRVERNQDLPAREIIVRDSAGDIVGQASARPVRTPGQGLEFAVTLRDGRALSIQLPPRGRLVGGVVPPLVQQPELLPGFPARGIPNTWTQGPNGLLWLMGILAFAVALGSYPVVRRLTKRLESLQRGVERLGQGDLRARVDASGHDEVAFLATRFNEAADRIEGLVQAHKSLLANASHELRSPLARIRMGIELMGNDSPSASPAAHTAALKAELARSIGELDALIDEILLASRLDAAQRDPQVDIGSYETIDLIALAAEECARSGVPLQCEVQSLQMQGVPKLMRRLLRNLLENARRHGGRDVSMVLRRGAIEVRDGGPGVPLAEREHIFEPFYRASHASEANGGVGLGLALVKSIAQRFGASVSCRAREDGAGACFVVDLP